MACVGRPSQTLLLEPRRHKAFSNVNVNVQWLVGRAEENRLTRASPASSFQQTRTLCGVMSAVSHLQITSGAAAQLPTPPATQHPWMGLQDDCRGYLHTKVPFLPDHDSFRTYGVSRSPTGCTDTGRCPAPYGYAIRLSDWLPEDAEDCAAAWEAGMCCTKTRLLHGLASVGRNCMLLEICTNPMLFRLEAV